LRRDKDRATASNGTKRRHLKPGAWSGDERLGATLQAEQFEAHGSNTFTIADLCAHEKTTGKGKRNLDPLKKTSGIYPRPHPWHTRPTWPAFKKWIKTFKK